MLKILADRKFMPKPIISIDSRPLEPVTLEMVDEGLDVLERSPAVEAVEGEGGDAELAAGQVVAEAEHVVGAEVATLQKEKFF
jgi:hypothetical protein